MWKGMLDIIMEVAIGVTLGVGIVMLLSRGFF